MKKCKYCQSEIDVKAKICPNCSRKQSGIKKWIFLVIAIFIVFAAFSGSEDSTESNNSCILFSSKSSILSYNDANDLVCEVLYNKIHTPTESLLITLGEGKGDNWWCVLFPPLCLVEAEESSEVEYKFFIQELIEKYL